VSGELLGRILYRDVSDVGDERNLVATLLRGEAVEALAFGDDECALAAGVARRAWPTPLIVVLLDVEVEHRDDLAERDSRLDCSEVMVHSNTPVDLEVLYHSLIASPDC